MSDFKLPSSEDLMAAMASIENSRSNIPTADDLYDTGGGAGYTKWRMPAISSALASKNLAGGSLSLQWSVPGDYTKTQKLYHVVNGTAQEVLPTGVVGTLVDVELRPSLPSNPGTPSLSVIGVYHQGKCLKKLPNLSTGIFSGIYNYSDNPELRYKAPSKELARLKYKPVTTEGLLEDLIKSGRSTGTITDKDGKVKEVSFNNRGMAYMYVTAIKVDTAIASDSDGNPVITKVMNRAEVMANLVTTERRVEGKVYRTYTYTRIIPMSDILNEDGEPIGNFFLAINMSNGAMKGNYKDGYANVCKYVSAIQNGKGMKAPLGRTLTEDEGKTLQSINERGLYRQPLWWLTVMTLVPKEVQAGTNYSVPHFEGFNPFGSSCYEGVQHETWADAYKGSSLGVSYLSETLRDKLRYNFSTISECLKLWDAALAEAGFSEEVEEFTLESVKGKVRESKPYMEAPYALPNANNYVTEADDEAEEDLYE